MSVHALRSAFAPAELEPAEFEKAARIATGLPVEVAGLSKSLEGQQVLTGIDLRIAPGEFVAVVGRSGCGKSTLLRLLAGLDSPTTGTVRLGGEPVAGPGGEKRIMFQDSRLLPWRRVIQNVALGLPRSARD